MTKELYIRNVRDRKRDVLMMYLKDPNIAIIIVTTITTTTTTTTIIIVVVVVIIITRRI